MDNKVTALYARLSKDDEQQGESNSIANQHILLEEYAKEHGFDNTVFYADDGISGTTFQRPSLQKLLEDVEAGIIATVIVKDLSRFGRNHLLVGYYTDIIFADAGVRFISILDNVDSVNGEDDITPFKNILNEWYAKDISKKQRASVKVRGMSGKRLTPRPIYGYTQDESKQWVVHEEAAKNVRMIFSMYLAGIGITEIAFQLRQRKIPCPAVYYFSAPPDNPYGWYPATVGKILTKQEYCGDTVNFRTTKQSFKSKKIIFHDESDYVIFPDTHEAIIDRETFALVRQKRQNIKRVSRTRKPALFSGYLYCADCGRKLYAHHSQQFDGARYYCSGYAKMLQVCSAHYITESVLCKRILSQLNRILRSYHDDSSAFQTQLQTLQAKSLQEQIQAEQKKLTEIQNRIQELDEIIKHLYEDKLNNEISGEVFRKLSQQYVSEQNTHKQSTLEMLRTLDTLHKQNSSTERFITALKKQNQFSDLNAGILLDFIDKIVVFENQKPHQRSHYKHIEIFYSGIGNLSGLFPCEM